MELEFKGTKGEWKVAGISESGLHHYNVIGTSLGNRFKIARVPFNHIEGSLELSQYDMDEAFANAKMIAASPTIYNALKNLLKRYKELVDSGDCGFWDAEKEQEYIDGINAINKALNGS